MRTTLVIDDAVLAAARSLAAAERVSIGTAVSRLAERGLRSGPALTSVKGFPVFDAPAERQAITLDMVNALRDE